MLANSSHFIATNLHPLERAVAQQTVLAVRRVQVECALAFYKGILTIFLLARTELQQLIIIIIIIIITATVCYQAPSPHSVLSLPHDMFVRCPSLSCYSSRLLQT
uniref:Uncharacterized protein n=1 Tax=Trypanosoma vivax (strain Y486) TaxID=1055687 RepID=G0U2F0_TRYVY|nr:hypothetical protein TVY486_0902750 [Trypanosoma vivax Y486]